MKRRDFLRLIGVSGAGVMMPLPSMRVFAQTGPYTGPLWLLVNCTGGWDPTSLWDPKGYTDPTDPARLNNYPKTSIDQPRNASGNTVGSPLRYAPPPDSLLADTALYRAKTFFDKYYPRMLVINGVDSRTNSHDDGQRHNWSGELARMGFPNIGALIAGAAAQERPMSFVTNGGYSATGNLTVASRLNSNGLSALYEVAYPNRSQTASSATSRLYYPDASATDTRGLIKTAASARTQALLDSQLLLGIREALVELQAARGRPNLFATMADNLATYPALAQTAFNGRSSAFGLYQQGHTALAAYETGVAAAVQISIGGFDTHSNHDAQHYPRLMDMLQGLDAILIEAQTRGLADRIVVMIGSDFGRTPTYNADNGKDHWPVTSMMLMGNSTQTIRGNRVIGASTDTFTAMWIDSTTLQPVAPNTTGAIRLTPGIVHQALRRLAGVENTTEAIKFALNQPQVSLFV